MHDSPTIKDSSPTGCCSRPFSRVSMSISDPSRVSWPRHATSYRLCSPVADEEKIGRYCSNVLSPPGGDVDAAEWLQTSIPIRGLTTIAGHHPSNSHSNDGMGKYPKGTGRRDRHTVSPIRPSSCACARVPVPVCDDDAMQCGAVRWPRKPRVAVAWTRTRLCRARSGRGGGGGDALLAGVDEVGKKSRADIVGMHGRNLKPKSDNNSDGGMPDRSPTGHQHTRSSVKSGVSPTQPPWGDSSVVLHRRRVGGYGGRGPTGAPLFSPLLLRRRETNGCARPKAWAWASHSTPGQDRRSKVPSCSAVPAQGRRCACRGRQGEWERVVRMQRAEWGFVGNEK